MSKNPEPASRKKILRQKGLCFICFSKEHLASSCKFHYICRKCNGKHHISICIFDPSKSYANFPVKKIPSMQLLIIFPAIKTVSLQTALATATKVSGKLHSETLLLFDSGSHILPQS